MQISKRLVLLIVLVMVTLGSLIFIMTNLYAIKNAPSLTYLGRASVKLTLADQRVIYIDPYAGTADDYAEPADLVLITHQHSDHNVDQMVTLKEDALVLEAPIDIRPGDILNEKGIEIIAVDAYNSNHSKGEGVGLILKFEDLVLYHSGDTSYFEDMKAFKKHKIDYALLCMDGYYNMGPDEASRVASIIEPKYAIPIHTAKSGDYNESNAIDFDPPVKIIVKPKEVIKLK